MKQFFFIIFLWILIYLPNTINGEVCSVNGRNCSHNCITTNGASRCGCPCGSNLTMDNTTCANVTGNCSLDIFFGIDVGRHIDPMVCNQSGTVFPTWLRWRANVIALLENFQVMENLPDVNIGASTYAGPPPYPLQTIVNYGSSPNIAQGIAALNATTMINCSGDSEFIQHAQFAGDNSGGISPFVYRGPGPLRSILTTTRVAIGVVYRYDENGPNEDQILIMRQRVLLSFHAIIIVTKTHSNSAIDRINTERARLAACGFKTAPCPNVFWVDRLNDEGIPISRQAIMATVNRQACDQANSLMFTSCTGSMAFGITLCALQGLRWNELQFKDPSCSLASNIRNTVGRSYWFNEPFCTCGMTQEYVVVNGVVKQRFVQTITTRNTTTCPNVSLTITCTIAAFNNFTSLSLRPRSKVRASQSGNGNFGVMIKAYSDSSFTTLAPDLMFVIDCTVYIQVKVTIPFGLTVVLNSCWATPSPNRNDLRKYDLIVNGCLRDSRTTVLSVPTSDLVRFSFAMFEFSSGYKLPKNEKPPVYIHCSLNICERNSGSIGCFPPLCAPSGRGRRDTDKKAPPPESITATIGPFKVINKQSDDVNEVKQPEPEKTKEISKQLNEQVSSYRLISIVTPWRAQWSNTTILFLISLILMAFLMIYFGCSVQKQRRDINSYALIKPPAYQDIEPLLNSAIQQSSTEKKEEP